MSVSFRGSSGADGAGRGDVRPCCRTNDRDIGTPLRLLKPSAGCVAASARVAAVHAARSRSRAAIALLVVGFALVSLVAATPGSPLQPLLPPDGEGGPIGWLAGALGIDAVGGNAAVVVAAVAVSVAVVGFVLVLGACSRGEVSVRVVVGVAVAFHAVVMMLPLLFSRDVYSYAMYGRIAGVYGRNP
jgi:hypothetical protein